MNHVVVREYGLLTCHPCEGELTTLSETAFAWLRALALNQEEGRAKFLRLVAKYGVECVRLSSYVGVVQTPCGTIIEILPKFSDDNFSPESSRALLWKMLSSVYQLGKLSQDASLQRRKEPLIEILIRRFLDESMSLLRRGLRGDYTRFESEEGVLKGKLNVGKQIRKTPAHQHHFSVQYDVFSINRPENRLLKTAMIKISKWSKSVENQRLVHELLFHLDTLPRSVDIEQDLHAWSKDRELHHYDSVKKWILLILAEESPWFLSGNESGISMLFQMEKLFEKYIEHHLRKGLKREYQVFSQSSVYSLVNHLGESLFHLRPDYFIRHRYNEAKPNIFDAKWKFIDATDRKSKYTISQADLYQLFAYGHQCLQGEGEMALVFPKHALFEEPLAVFDFSKKLKLWILPFDLEKDYLRIPNDAGFFTKFEPIHIGRSPD